MLLKLEDKSEKKCPILCSKIAPASPGVSDKKSPAPGGLGASIPRPRSGGGGPGAFGGLAPGVGNSSAGQADSPTLWIGGIKHPHSLDIDPLWILSTAPSRED